MIWFVEYYKNLTKLLVMGQSLRHFTPGSSDVSSKTVVLCNKVLCTLGMLFCMYVKCKFCRNWRFQNKKVNKLMQNEIKINLRVLKDIFPKTFKRGAWQRTLDEETCKQLPLGYEVIFSRGRTTMWISMEGGTLAWRNPSFLY